MRDGVDGAGSARFRILEPLGSGGFGAVFEAVDTRSGQRVAIKRLDDRSARSVARFKQEFRALADCHHPNLVSLKELYEENGRWSIVMELVEGSDFLTYVRGNNEEGPLEDDTRLRHALLGVAQGLTALHGYGILHRDLKPSNVRVTPQGRAVLLDFGLATSVDPQRQSIHALTVGTVAYMAPEQAQQQNFGPPVDWYAFGACLFEALTGQLPFEGDSAIQILLSKRERPAPLASSLAPSVAPDLDGLCASLLQRDPTQRATARDVMRVLGEASSEASGLVPQRIARVGNPPPFSGRDAELLQLSHALARTHQNELRIVLVEGESGVGKSELIAEFLRRARAEQPNLVALRGRCYENEHVAYKAFDGCIDELSRVLRRMPERACAQLLPPRSALLGQMFPVLRTIAAIANAPRGEQSADPTARRLEAFTALSSLLTRLAEERPVVLAIDDLQWADLESFRLMLAMVEQPEPPPVLIVASIRPQEERDPDLVEQLEIIRRKKPFDVVQLLGLPQAQAEALAQKLLGKHVPPEWLRTIADESHGHPLLLSELVHFTESRDLSTRGALTLDAALSARLQRVDKRARELLEVVALAARPHGDHIFARALGVENVSEPARTLLAENLLRVRRGHELGVYHDRIRQTAVKLIPKARLTALHRSLAAALASDPAADVSEQARHWDLGSNVERAVQAYERAAEGALDALAFMRAAQLCARAIELVGDDADPRVQRLSVQRAHALARAGHSAEAADLYERAIARAEGEAQLWLRARHAQHLMLSGKLEHGLSVARALLGELGIHVPESNAAIVLHIAIHRLWLSLRGTHFKLRAWRADEGQAALAHELLAMFSQVFAPLHPLFYVLLALIGVRRAARHPVAQTVTFALDTLGWLSCLRGSDNRAPPLFERSRAIIDKLGDTRLMARHLLLEGSARLAAWDWSSGRRCLEQAHELLQQHELEEPAMITNARYHLGITYYHLGEHEMIAQQTTRWMMEARERNDALGFALLTGLGYGFVRHLMRDQPDQALEELDAALAVVPSEPFSFVHLGHLNGTVLSLLYRGGTAAHEYLRRHAERHRKPLLLRSPMGRDAMRVFACLAALQAHALMPEKQRAGLRAGVAKQATKLAGRRPLLSRIYAQLLLAQVLLLEGQRSKALAAARVARMLANEAPNHYARSARYLEALLESEDPHDPRCTEVLTFLSEQGFRAPLRFLQVSLPVITQLTARVRAQKDGPEPTRIGRYEVIGALGGGGFATVFEVREIETGRKFALKELVSTSARALERFKREFRALRDLSHVNLVRLDALFEHDGSWYIAMEHVDGTALTEYARPQGVADRARIVEAFGGLVEGLSALHEAGFVHRDVKSENVRVTAEGRAVLLDHGLIARAGEAREESAVGSFEYAAPEQLEGSAPAPAADVYAVGVCLYEALSGRLPFVESVPALLLEQKRAVAPAQPTREPDELTRLTMQMLAPDPRSRPPLAALRTLLRQLARHEVDRTTPSTPDEPTAHFAGREHELSSLDAAFERTCDVGLTITLVEGESGVGKSALVDAFVGKLGATFPRLWLLRSRCYENEQIAFKGFDGAIDELSRALRGIPGPTCEMIMPKRAALLGQLFPVLETVPAIAHAPKKGLPVEPAARQRAAVTCFCELLEQLAKHVELLFVIDDLQWADADTFQLLRALLDRRVSLPLLIVCTLRPDHELSREAARELRLLRTRDSVSTVRLEGLSEAAVMQLASELHGAPLPRERAQRLAQESKGHPLFLRELVEHERSEAAGGRMPTLDAALTAQIQRFSDAQRMLLAMVALADKPYGPHVFARALGVPELSRGDLVALLSRGMLRRCGDDRLATFHDHIRRLALSLLAPDERRALARKLAAVLDSERRADPAERARLWDEAGDRERACAAYEQAGDRALDGLSFAHAAQHYDRALALLGEGPQLPPGPAARSLLLRRGQALGSAGRSGEAARVFQQAALDAQGDEAVHLKILAAQHLIQSGQVDEGMHAARALLQGLGISLPTSVGSALGSLLVSRALLALEGRSPKPPVAPIAARTRMQLDAAWALAPPIAWIDPLASAVLSMRHLRMALRSGEPSHIARALAEEAFSRTVQDARDPRVSQLLERARTIALELRDPALEATLMYRQGTVATYRWEFEAARAAMESAQQMISERCPDQPFLLTNVRSTLGSIWTNRGEHARFADAARVWLDEARQRGDRFALTMISGLGYGFIARLMANDPNSAQEEMTELIACWPKEPFSFAHLGELLAMSCALLYRGGDHALRWHETERARLSRAFLLRSGMGKAIYLSVRTLALLSAETVAGAAEAARLRAEARATVRTLGNVRTMYAAHAAPFLLAQLAALEGDREQALLMARDVCRKAEESGYLLHAHRARFLAATLAADSEQSETCASVLAYYEKQGWQRPRRVITMWCPILTGQSARPQSLAAE